jgi:hypothetical protein
MAVVESHLDAVSFSRPIPIIHATDICHVDVRSTMSVTLVKSATVPMGVALGLGTERDHGLLG